MKKKIKNIDLLCLISLGEEVPKRIKYNDCIYKLNKIKTENGYDVDYYCDYCSEMLFADVIDVHRRLNDEVEILDEEDKDIPLIPDDELYDMSNVENYKSYEKLAYNFKVLKEKINQVVEEFNEYRKGE